MKALLAGMNLFREIDAWRAMELTDNDTLGAIDDKLSPADHLWNLAEVDLFLDGLFLFEAKANLEREPEGQAKIPALGFLVARSAKLVADILERHAPIVAGNRKYLAQDRFEPEVVPVGVVLSCLQKIAVSVDLQLHEVGDVNCIPPTAKGLRR